ncbi:MAG: prefoldin subunit alpha [Candidatus Micrarchaeota archaeon]|nr:prefoldin subunit alpha [Candidatus Micrarchaeota archaeon]
MEINREEIQKIAIEAENLQRMHRMLRDQIVALNMASLEASVTINSLEKIRGGENSLVSLGSGVFASASMAKSKYVLLDLGGGICGEMSSEKAISILKKRIEDSRGIIQRLEEDLKRVQGSLIELEGKARKYIQQ